MSNPLAPVVLTANTVATFNLDADYDRVEVLNADGADEVFFRTDKVNPAVNGAGSHYIPAAVGSLVVSAPGAGATQVRVVSAGTPKVSVRGLK